MNIKEFMGITNPSLTNAQVATIFWFGFALILALVAILVVPNLAIPVWLQLLIFIPIGLNVIASARILDDSGIDVKE